MRRIFIAGISMLALVFIVSYSSAQMGGGIMGEQKGDMQKGMGGAMSMMPSEA